MGNISWPTMYAAILLIALLVSVYVLGRRYRSRRELVRRVAELEALSRAGGAIVASQLDIAALCALIAQEAGQVIDNQTFQIGLFEDLRYRIEFWTINGQRQPTPQTFDLSEKSGMVGWIHQSKQALLVHDFVKEINTLPARPRYISDSPPRSAIFIPLISGDDVIGIVAAQSSQPNRFTEDDLRRLTILANQAAAAIANAELFSQERNRAAHLELVGQIAQKVNAIQDLDELFKTIVNLTQVTFGFNSVNIFIVDPNTQEAVVEASSLPQLEPGSLRIAAEEGLIGTVVANRASTLANNTDADSRFQRDDISTETRSEIAIPLIVDDELLGVLDVQSQDIGAFSYREQTVLEALAAQAAIAIHKARQFTTQREQAWTTTAQLQVAEMIGHSSNLESLTEGLVRLTPLLIGVDQCSILLWDEDFTLYRGAAAFGFPSGVDQRFDQLEIEIGRWHALDAVHVGLEAIVSQQPLPWLDTKKHKDYFPAFNVLFPLIAKGSPLGVMVVGNRRSPGSNGQLPSPDGFGNGREEILRNIVAQSTQAIESIQLYIAQQEEAWVNTALLQVAEAVNKLTNLDEILDTIVRMVPMLVGVDVCLILIWDQEKEAFLAGPSHGLSEMAYGVLDSFEIEMSEFSSLKAQDVERIGPDATYYTFRLPGWMHDIMGSKTADAFPLYARGQLVGNMLIGPAENGRKLAGRRLNIITGIAQQAAIAVVNDHLYKESAERSRMEQELNVARSIQASLIPAGSPDIPGCVVASFWEAARQVSGDFYDFLPLPDGRWGIAIADVADKGVPASLFMALSRTVLRTVAFNRRSPADVLSRANQLIYNDAQTDLFVTVFYAIWDPAKRLLTYASGGHNPPILLHANGQTTELQADGIALGVLEDMPFAEGKVKLRPDDTIIFYTDGATEAMNEDFDEFGLERLCLIARENRQTSPQNIVAAIIQAIQDHSGNTPQFDDITMVIMKCLGTDS